MRFRWSSTIFVLACVLRTSMQAGIGAAEPGGDRYFPDDLSGRDRFYPDESLTGNDLSDTDESNSYEDDDSDVQVLGEVKSQNEDEVRDPLEESKRNLFFTSSRVARFEASHRIRIHQFQVASLVTDKKLDHF